MGNMLSKCSREGDGDETGGPKSSTAGISSTLSDGKHALEDDLPPCHAGEQIMKEKANTMKEVFLRGLRELALCGRMSRENECLLMQWAKQRGQFVAVEMEVFLMEACGHGDRILTRELQTLLMRLRHPAYCNMLDEEELYCQDHTDIDWILHEPMAVFGLRRLAAELWWLLRDAARSPPDTRCCETSSDPTNEFCESFHYSLVGSW